MKIVPFTDAHLDDAAEMLAARHAQHRAAEPLLPADIDFRAEIEKEWTAEGASGVISPAGYLIGSPQKKGNANWMWMGVAAHALEGDAEHARDLYAAAAQRWVDEGHREHAVFVPAHDLALVDAWFRLSFGSSGALAMRETAGTEDYDADVAIRPGTPNCRAITLRRRPSLRGAADGGDCNEAREHCPLARRALVTIEAGFHLISSAFLVTAVQHQALAACEVVRRAARQPAHVLYTAAVYVDERPSTLPLNGKQRVVRYALPP